MKDIQWVRRLLSCLRCVSLFLDRDICLGIPTANFSDDVVDNLPPDFTTGVYCGFASVDSGPVYKMVMSIGWNPFYDNEKKSMETHILNRFDGDLYGQLLK